MKIVCSSCETSYQIDDRKVTGTGRVFRIGCRSCNEPILVDGLDGQGAGLTGWYLNAGGERHGPLDLPQLRSRLSAGAVDPSALIWSNGLDGWRPASDLDAIVAPWEAETIQAAPQEQGEEGGETTLISMDEIARVHAELEARDAPLLSDDEVEIVEEMLPPELPMFEPSDAVAETVQLSSSDELPDPGEIAPSIPPFDPPDAVAETVQRVSSEEDGDGDVAQTLVFKLDPSTLGSGPSLPEASEVIPSSDTGEDIHEVGGRAAALFRLDDLDLGNESKAPAPAGEAALGLPSNSLFVGDRAKPTDPAAVRARPRPAGTVTTNVPMVKKKGRYLLPVLGWMIVGVAAGYVLRLATLEDAPPAPPAPAHSTAVASRAAPAVEPAPEKTPEVQAPAETPPTPVATPLEAAAPVPDPPAAAAEAPVVQAKSAPEPKTPKEVNRSPDEAARSAAKRARIRAARRALREEPLPNFGRAPRKSRSERAKPEPKAAKESSSVNDLLGQLKNGSKGEGDDGLERAPQKLSASEVRGTLRKRQSRFKSCYRQMVNRPEGAVTVKTSFKIVSSGRVTSARIVSAAGVDSNVQGCILDVVRGAKFPRFRDPEMIVNYPILLR